jgi:hypothetical protein
MFDRYVAATKYNIYCDKLCYTLYKELCTMYSIYDGLL